MTHAWLFTGPPGSGRSVAARAFAAALQCERPDVSAAASAPACHTVLSRAAIPTCASVVPDGLSISVAEMRAVVATAARRLRRSVAGRSCVIEDADRLTEAASERAAQGRRGAAAADGVPALRAVDAPGRRHGDHPVPVPASSRCARRRPMPSPACCARRGRPGRRRVGGRGRAGSRRAGAAAGAGRRTRAPAAPRCWPFRLRSRRSGPASRPPTTWSPRPRRRPRRCRPSSDAGEIEALQIALGAGGTGKGARR